MLKANAGIYECIGQIYSIRDEEKFFAASGLLIILGKRYRIIVTNHILDVCKEYHSNYTTLFPRP